jgi:GxxExxY protein
LSHEEHEGSEAHEGLPDEVERLSAVIVDAGLKVHRALGPGLLESAYEHCVAHELELRRLKVRKQIYLPIVYEGLTLEAGYRLDLLVEDAIVLEVKAVDALTRVHEAQLLTYLRLSGKRLGFLMNFNETLFKQRLRRIVR